MYRLDESLVVSPTDLTRFLECAHATRLDLAVAEGVRPPPSDAPDEVLTALFARGLSHERAYLQSLRDSGASVATIDVAGSGRDGLMAAERATEDAMASGVDVIYQATFFDGRWRGHADFLLRRSDRPGRWPWSYDVADTKLARRMKVSALLQMATYADRLTVLQKVAPEKLIVITGDNQTREFRFADAQAYAGRVRRELLTFVGGGDVGRPAIPEPVAHCPQCRWRPTCTAQWRLVDDLSLVAFMRTDHARALREAGITTVRALGESAVEDLPASIGVSSRERLVQQARLQLTERRTGTPEYELLPAQPGRGLSRLPEPSPGDVFFDMEGDPLFGEAGLEYLFGVVDRGSFTCFWALDATEEKRAFENLVDHLMQCWATDPGMHVYHYAPYESSRLKSLSGRYATRQAEVDRLLRGERLVDLYAVVRQGLRISKESYSIKQLEAFYWNITRPHEGVSDAMGSVVAFERWLDIREKALAENVIPDNSLLVDIASYNEDDCRSTQALRDWLERLRTAGGGSATFPRPELTAGVASDAVQKSADAVARTVAALLATLPTASGDRTDADRATVLLADLLDWHRRESLPEWWEYFARLNLSDDELVDDGAAIGETGDAEEVGMDKRSKIWRMTFPPQDTKIGPGDAPVDPHTSKSPGTVVRVDAEQGWIELKSTRGRPTCRSLVPPAPVNARSLRDRLLELGGWVAEHGMRSPEPQWRAARDLLLRRSPRVAGPGGDLRFPGEPAERALIRLAGQLDHGVLPVQGPPGTGKTWAGARMVLELLRAGKRVGIAAFSHRAVGNLLDAVCDAAGTAGPPVRAMQRAEEHQACRSASGLSPGVELADNDAVERALDSGSVDLVAGTPWLFARERMRDRFDVLVIDEAGQLSLANVLAVSGAAESLVLLGDPQQLSQPVKGSHPAGAEVSALQHILGALATLPPDQGILLDQTWRMHSQVANFVSAMSYDGRLHVEPGCDRQQVESGSLLGGTGLRLRTVDHIDNTSASVEEAEAVLLLCAAVLADGWWTDRDGTRRKLEPTDLMVLAPFNAQVDTLRRRLDPLSNKIRIGTVDKFQGQQAPVVIYSMAASSAQDAPRGTDFLYSLNRFTVAVSRAQAVMAVVCSPKLLRPPVHFPEQLRRVNALCRFAEVSVQ